MPEYRCDLAVGHLDLGNLYKDTGRPKEAEAAYKEAIAILKILADKHPEVPEYQNHLAGSHNNVGSLYQNTGRVKEAEAAHKEALAIYQSLIEIYPNSSEYRERLATTYYNLACIHAKSLAKTNSHAGTDAAHPAAPANTLIVNAFDCLQKACDLGLFDDPKSLEHLKKDSDLDVLRNRPEYKELLNKIAARAKTKSPQSDSKASHKKEDDAKEAKPK